jgi:hypothetical protein
MLNALPGRLAAWRRAETRPMTAEAAFNSTLNIRHSTFNIAFHTSLTFALPPLDLKQQRRP